ncbi:hypothetical protein SUDANB106_01158 [Streptomyces sp. enrichment culture]
MCSTGACGPNRERGDRTTGMQNFRDHGDMAVFPPVISARWPSGTSMLSGVRHSARKRALPEGTSTAAGRSSITVAMRFLTLLHHALPGAVERNAV